MYKNCHKYQPDLLSPCKVERKKFRYNNPCQPDESGKKKNSPPSVPDDTPKPVNSLQKALSRDYLGGEQLKNRDRSAQGTRPQFHFGGAFP